MPNVCENSGVPLIEIVAPDPTWPDQFAEIERDLEAVVGSIALRIDHIGSTSVPGLAAKDIIDVQVTVAVLGSAIIDAMAGAGFVHRSDIDADRLTGCDRPDELRKLYFNERPGDRRANIHVRMAGCLNQRYALLFRDHLCTNEALCDGYAELKRVLAREYPDDPGKYYDIKDPVMDIIYRSAECWAATVGWTQ